MTEKILVIDDDLDSLKLIGLLLQRQGYQIAAAPGGKEGLAQAANENPDLILLDIMMPDMNGYEVCRELRSNPKLAHIPVIMFTAKTRVDDKIAGFEAGADDYLTKPTHPAELASRVKALLARSVTERSPIAGRPSGKVIAVLGVKGGCGVTTLAVNLSASIAAQQAGRKSVILADLQHGTGAVGLQLGRDVAGGLSDLLQVRLDDLNKERVEQVLVDYAPGLRLLLASYNPAEATALIPANNQQRIMELVAQAADLVVFDLGSLSDAMLPALKMADQVIVALPPQRTLRPMAQRVLEYIKQVGLPAERIGVVVVNATHAPTGVHIQELEYQLQVSVLGDIPAAPELADLAAENGKPMVTLQPDGMIADRFREMAKRLLARLEEPGS